MRTIVIAAIATVALIPESPADAASARSSSRVIAVGEAREQIQNTPILERPNRPLHVYGNTVRRRHQRGVSRP